MSDKKFEQEIVEILSAEKDLEEYLTKQNDWDLLQNLSKIRHNLLEWYTFKKEASLLEIGSGYGAMSGLFCEKVERVVSLEESKVRAAVNAVRNQTYHNLEIVVGGIEQIPPNEKFDYITLLDIPQLPYVEILDKIKGFLKPTGILILAMENKLGLKYFAGAPESITGKNFAGIEDYRNVEDHRTFSKPELEKMLEDSGFSEPAFYYPVPDYRLPTTIYSEDYLPGIGDLRQMQTAYDRERSILFQEDVVFDQLCKDGRFDYFANSFLVFAPLQMSAKADICFAKYNRTRAPEYRICTTIYKENEETLVEKKPLGDRAVPHIKSLREKSLLTDKVFCNLETVRPVIQDEVAIYPYIDGITLDKELQQYLADTDQLIKKIKRYIDLIFKTGPEFEADGKFTVANLDLLFDNIMLKNDTLYVIDCEWVFEQETEKDFLVFRCLDIFYGKYSYYLESKMSFEEFLKHFGFTAEQAVKYRKDELKFQQIARGENLKYDYMRRYVKELSVVADLSTYRQELSSAYDDITRLNELVHAKEDYAKELEDIIEMIRKNPFYRASRIPIKLYELIFKRKKDKKEDV